MTAPRPAAIEVLELRRVDGAGSLRAFAKVRLGAVVIHGVRVIQQDGQRPWVALPQMPGRQRADGSGAGWFPVVEITRKELFERIRDAVLEAWERHEAPIRPPVRGTATRERTRAPRGSGADGEPFYDDSAEAIADLEGRGR